METYISWMAAAGAEVYIILGIFAFALLGGLTMGIMRARNKMAKTKLLPKAAVEQKESESAEAEKSGSALGTGELKCMCFKANNVLDFTTIPKPVGEIYQFEPSCPISGAGYIVKEEQGGEIKDYDPRDVEVHIEQTPEFAWFATHWDIVTRNFWAVAVQWWKSPSTWFAVIMMIVVFICALVVFD